MAKPCRDILGGLGDYLDGEAGRELCKRLEAHLAGCPACRVVVDTTRRTVELYGARTRESIPRECQERLHALLKSAWRVG